MAAIDAKQVKELRDKTGSGMMDCKKALGEAGGDVEKALQILRERGLSKAEKKSARSVGEGRVHAYIHHGGKIGVLVEVACETDFVARNEQFVELCNDIAMQVAAAQPDYVNPDEVPEEVLAKEREIYMNQARNEGKPEKILEKIAEGKMKKYLEHICLTEQIFVKDPEKKIKDIVVERVAKLGENIMIKRFVRFQIGEEE